MCSSATLNNSNYLTMTHRSLSQKVHTPPEDSLMDLNLYEDVCTETLEELHDYFEEILENTTRLDSNPDVLYSVSSPINVPYSFPDPLYHFRTAY